MASTTAVDWVLLDNAGVQVGDLVSADAGGMPTYRVVDLQGGRAWVRDGAHDFVWDLPVSVFRWKAAS